MIDRRELAEQFVVFCDGVEAAGMREYAHVGRCVAEEFLRTLSELDGERSARVAIQERAQRFEALWRKAST